MSDVRRGPRRAPSAGHDVAGPDLQLDLPDVQVRLAARFRSGNVAPYTCPVEKHASVEKFALRRVVCPPPRPPPALTYAGSRSRCHSSVLHWYLSYNASTSWWGPFTCMLGLVHMRHKFRLVRSPQVFEFTVEILFWKNKTESRAPIRPSSAARKRNRAHSPQNTNFHAHLLCTWQKHTKEFICKGGSQGVWRSKCYDLLCRIRTRPCPQCQFRRKKEIEFIRQVLLLSEVTQQLKREFGSIAMKRSRHVHVIQTCFGRPLIGFRCFADKPWTGRIIFGSLEKNVRRKAWLWKKKVK
jgi:hypothetical protein